MTILINNLCQGRINMNAHYFDWSQIKKYFFSLIIIFLFLDCLSITSFAAQPILIKNPDGSSVVTKSDGTQIVTNADGSSVQTKPDGTKIVTNVDHSSVIYKPDGTKLITNTDGSSVQVNPDGKKIIKDPSGKILN